MDLTERLQKTFLAHVINLSIFQKRFYEKRSSGVCFQLCFPERAWLSLSLHLALLCARAFQSRYHSEFRERQFLINCLLNHMPPDCAAKMTSLSNEESPMAVFCPLKTSVFRSLLMPQFSEFHVVTVHVTITTYKLGAGLGVLQILLSYWTLMGSSQILFFSQKNSGVGGLSHSLPKVTWPVWVKLRASLGPCLYSLL